MTTSELGYRTVNGEDTVTVADFDSLVASAAGPDVDIRDPLPVAARPPQVSLLTSATDVTPILDAEYGKDKWINGIVFEPEGAALNLVTEYPYFWTCPETGGSAWSTITPGGTKQVPAKPTNIANRPLMAHTADPCISTFGMFGRQTPERAARLLEANLPRIIENELWTGTRSTSAGFVSAGPPIRNDFLTNAATELNGAAAEGVFSALAELEQAYFDRDNRPGMVHAQPRIVQLWVRAGVVNPSPSGRQLTTPLGTVVVPGVGYPGSRTSGGAAGSRTSSWAFITGPVMYARTEVFQQSETLAAQTRGSATFQDRVTRAECYFSVFWDSKVKVGVNINPLVELA